LALCSKTPGAMALPFAIDPWQAAHPFVTNSRCPSEEPTGVGVGTDGPSLPPQAATSNNIPVAKPNTLTGANLNIN